MRVSRPSPATVISLVALFVALGGTGYAVTALPRDSVGSRSCAPARSRSPSSATARDHPQAGRPGRHAARSSRRGAVTGDRVAADALGGAQIDESTLAAVPFATEAARAPHRRRVPRSPTASSRPTARTAPRPRRGRPRRGGRRRGGTPTTPTTRTSPTRCRGGRRNEASYDDRGRRRRLDHRRALRRRTACPSAADSATPHRDSDFPSLLALVAGRTAGWRLEHLRRASATNDDTVRGTAYAICVEADGRSAAVAVALALPSAPPRPAGRCCAGRRRDGTLQLPPLPDARGAHVARRHASACDGSNVRLADDAAPMVDRGPERPVRSRR